MIFQKICSICNKSFNTSNKSRSTCSIGCYNKSGNARKRISEAKWALNSSQRSEVFKLWVNGRPYDFLAFKFNVSKSAIFRICKNLSKETGLIKNKIKKLQFHKSTEYKIYLKNNKLSDKEKSYFKNYRLKNKDIIKQRKKNYYDKNKKEILKLQSIKYNQISLEDKKEKNKEYYLKYKDRITKHNQKKEVKLRLKIRNQSEHVKEKKKEYRLKNIEKVRSLVREWDKNKRKIDPLYALMKNTQSRFRGFLKANRLTKKYRSSKIMDLIGCDPDQLKSHLENQFHTNTKTGEIMTWNNYGRWHVDHKIPLKYFLDKFDYENDIEVQKKAWNYLNLQPLWAEDNIKKSDKF